MLFSFALWGAKTMFTPWIKPICRQTRGFGTPQLLLAGEVPLFEPVGRDEDEWACHSVSVQLGRDEVVIITA